MTTLSLTETQCLKALGDFIASILPGVQPVVAQVNRVPEVTQADFVVMTPTLRRRLAWNTNTYEDNVFVGSIAGNTMTISEVTQGVIAVGNTVFGVGVADSTVVTAILTGTGGVGTYTVSGAPQTIDSEVIACGIESHLQPTELTVQLDIHGPNSADNAQVISTLWRDGYAFDFMQAATDTDAAPLYMNDPRQTPFLNGEQQTEWRWVAEAVMQVNPVVETPQQFADMLSVSGIINVDAAYPPQ